MGKYSLQRFDSEAILYSIAPRPLLSSGRGYFLAPPAGLEPAPLSLEGSYPIRLDYGGNRGDGGIRTPESLGCNQFP